MIRFHRLSIPGYYCFNCAAKMGESIVCPGCKWVDPLTMEKGVRTDNHE